MAELDWSKTQEAEGQVLFRVVKPLRDAWGMKDWNQFFAKVLPGDPPVSDSYETNFRAGRMSKSKAARLYAWLRHHEPELADRVDREIAALYATNEPSPSWTQLVALHGEFSRLQARPLPVPSGQMKQGQFQIHAGWTPPPVTLPLDRLFAFDLDSPLAGYAIVLQKLRGRWMPLPLSPERIGETVEQGSQTLPRAPQRVTPDAYYGFAADHHGLAVTKSGFHEIAFLIVPVDIGAEIEAQLFRGSTIPVTQLDQIAADVLVLPRASWRLYKIGLFFPEAML